MRNLFQRAVAAFERRLATRRSEWVLFLGGIIKQLEQRVAFLEGELVREASLHQRQLSGQSDAIAEAERKFASSQHDHHDAMASADEVIDELRSKYAALDAELAGVKQSLELKNKALEVAEEQNETLWEVIERDRARVQAERHAYQRAAAEAANAARTVGVEEIEGE